MAEVKPPPWWRWYEPPRWVRSWLHLIVCTHCRHGMRSLREDRKAASRG